MNEARYCKSCGAYIPENKDHCVACGNTVRTNGGGGGTGMTSHLVLEKALKTEIDRLKPIYVESDDETVTETLRKC